MKKKFKLKHLFDGSFITQEKVINQWRYVALIVVLAIVLIANNYATEKVIRDTNQIKKELKELQTEHLSVLSEYLKKSQQSEIAKSLDSLGIKESIVPPKTIFIREN